MDDAKEKRIAELEAEVARLKEKINTRQEIVDAAREALCNASKMDVNIRYSKMIQELYQERARLDFVEKHKCSIIFSTEGVQIKARYFDCLGEEMFTSCSGIYERARDAIDHFR